MKKVRIHLPADLLGSERGHLVVHLDETPPTPQFHLGNFILVKGQLYEVSYMYRLLSRPQEWQYVLEERHSPYSHISDDLWLHLHQSCCLGQHIPRIPPFLFTNMLAAIAFFKDVPHVRDTMEFDGSTLAQEGTIISSGEVVDDQIMTLRANLARMAFSSPEITVQIVQRTLPIAEALEEFVALEEALMDLPTSIGEDLPDDLRDVVEKVNQFIRDTDPDSRS